MSTPNERKTARNDDARRRFEKTVGLLMNCFEQHPGDQSRLLNYAMQLVMIDREIDPRGLPLPSPPSQGET